MSMNQEENNQIITQPKLTDEEFLQASLNELKELMNSFFQSTLRQYQIFNSVLNEGGMENNKDINKQVMQIMETLRRDNTPIQAYIVSLKVCLLLTSIMSGFDKPNIDNK